MVDVEPVTSFIKGQKLQWLECLDMLWEEGRVLQLNQLYIENHFNHSERDFGENLGKYGSM